MSDDKQDKLKIVFDKEKSFRERIKILKSVNEKTCLELLKYRYGVYPKEELIIYKRKIENRIRDVVKKSIDSRVRKDIGNQILCRKCNNPMKQAPLGVLAFYCKKCNVKAEIQYSKIPIIKVLKSE